MIQLLLGLFTNKERIIIAVLLVVLVALGITYKVHTSILHRELETKQNEYSVLLKDYNLEVTNNSILKNAINDQNRKVEEFKNESTKYELDIKELNATLQTRNQELKKLISSGTVKLPSSIKTSEDAVQWLKSNSKSLQ